jgi:hypothetical protein
MNRVITHYRPDEYGMYLLAATRMTYPYIELSRDQLQDICRQTNVRLPALHPVHTLKELLLLITRPPAQDVANYSEGFVVTCQDVASRSGIVRLKVKYDFWNVIHRIKGNPDFDTDREINPISRLTAELFWLLREYPAIIDVELSSPNPFIIQHTVASHYRVVDDIFTKKYQQMIDCRKRMIDNRIQMERSVDPVTTRELKKMTHMMVLDIFPHVYEQAVVHLREPIEAAWTQSRHKICYLNYLISSTVQPFIECVVYQSIILFGDPTSTDIDMALVVQSSKEFDKPIDEMGIRRTMCLDGRKLDINLIIVNNGMVVSAHHGGTTKIHDVMHHTYHLHKQRYPNPISQPISIDCMLEVESVRRDIVALALKVLRKSELLLEYKVLNDQSSVVARNGLKALRVASYKSDSAKIKSSLDILNQMVERPIDPMGLTTGWLDAMKSITMKIIQLVALVKLRTVCYVKADLAELFGSMYSTNPCIGSGAMYLLTRGTVGEFSQQCIETLIILYQELTDQYVDSPHQMIATKFDVEMSKVLVTFNNSPANQLVEQFTINPVTFTRKFIQLIKAMDPTSRNLNKRFRDDHCTNYHLLPREVAERTILAPQGSVEWLDLRENFYFCGNNKKFIMSAGDDWVQQADSLIRGNIGEAMVACSADFSNILGEVARKITVGLIVETVGLRGSRCIAPDLLLMRESGLIVPVEIKTIVGKPQDNQVFKRAVHIASIQVRTAREMIGRHLCDAFGIIALLHMYPPDVGPDQPYIFDLRCVKVY